MRPSPTIAGLLLAACLLQTACTAKTPVIDPDPTTTASGSISPSPSTSKKKDPTATDVVYVLGGRLFVYNVKRDAVTEVAKGEGIRAPRWINKDEVSFVQGDAIRLLNVKTREVSELLSVETGVRAYGWSPDRETIGYITVDEHDYPQVEFRSFLGSGSTLAVATLALAAGREGTAHDQARVEFDKKGQRALLVFTPSDGAGEQIPDDQSQLQVRSITGELLHAGRASGEPTMGVWSPDGRFVYYRTESGARVWTVKTGALQSVRGGARWFNPWPSRDGRTIAYDTGLSSKKVRVRVLNLRTGGTREVGPVRRFHPVIASKNIVWAQEARPCSNGCFLPMSPARAVYAIDVRTGKEKKLALKSLADADVLYR